jgi:hypothetical protein
LPELYRAAAKSQELTIKLFERVKAAKVIRSDITVVDIALLFEQLVAVQIGDSAKTAELRRRYVTLLFDALRRPNPAPRPGSPPD